MRYMHTVPAVVCGILHRDKLQEPKRKSHLLGRQYICMFNRDMGRIIAPYFFCPYKVRRIAILKLDASRLTAL